MLDFNRASPPPPPPPPSPPRSPDPMWAQPDLHRELQIPVGTAGPPPRVADPSGHCRTSTVSSRSQWALPDLNRDFQIAVGTARPQPRLPDRSGHCRTSTGRMSEKMSDRMPEDMPDRMPEDMPDRMPEGMPDRMPDKMSDRMPEDLPVTKCIHVMVGITRSKVHVMVGITRSKVIYNLQNHQPFESLGGFVYMSRDRHTLPPPKPDGSLTPPVAWGGSQQQQSYMGSVCVQL